MSHLRSAVRPISLLGLLTCGVAAAAPAPQGSFPVAGAGTGFELPGVSVPNQTYTRTATGDVFDDGLEDVFYLGNGNVDGRISIGIYDVHMRDVFTNLVNDPVLDFDIGGDLGQAKMFATDSSGVMSNVWSHTSNDWDEIREYTGTRWHGATKIRVVSRGPNSRPFLYGVMANGTDIRVLIPVSGGFLDRHVVSSPSPVLEFENVQAQAGGHTELAVVTTSGLSVYSGAWNGNSGVPIAQALTPGVTQASSLVTARSAGSSIAWMAWMHGTTLNPNTSVTVLELGSSAVTVAMGTTTEVGGHPFAAGSLVGGDLDNDGDSDLCMTNTQHKSLVALINTSGPTGAPAFAWNPTDARTYLVPQIANNFGLDRMFLTDLDNDSDVDYGVANLHTGDVFIMKSAAVVQDNRAPSIVIVEPADPDDEDVSPGDPQEFLVTNAFHLSFVYTEAPIVHANATHLELQLFEKESPGVELNNNRLIRQYYDLSTLDPDNDGLAGIGLDISPYVDLPPVPATDVTRFENMFFVTLRYVNYDTVSGEPTQVFPASVFGLEGAGYPNQPASVNETWLQQSWPATLGQLLDTFLEPPGTGVQGGGGSSGCGSTGGQCLPGKCDQPPLPK